MCEKSLIMRRVVFNDLCGDKKKQKNSILAFSFLVQVLRTLIAQYVFVFFRCEYKQKLHLNVNKDIKRCFKSGAVKK